MRSHWAILLAGAAVFMASACEQTVRAEPVAEPREAHHRLKGDTGVAEAMFGAGCFWSVEVAFRNTEGVLDVAVGYSGGHKENPTYREVCTGNTGHAEVVHVQYDPAKVSYETLLETFWESHDPTQLNRQGPDIGTQYRSAIFYYSPEQKEAAKAAIEALNAAGKYARPIVTEVTEADVFWRAEEYHQRYLEKRGLATCRI